MYRIFDYIFYRAANFYKRRDDAAPEVGGIVLVSFVQVLIAIDIMIYLHARGSMPEFINNVKTFGIVLSIFIIVLNSIRYHKKKLYTTLDEKWGKEKPQTRELKTAIFIVFVIISVVSLFANGGK